MKKCLVTRNDNGQVTSVSGAMTEDQIEEHKELLKGAGADEGNLQVVPKEVGRQMKRDMV